MMRFRAFNHLPRQMDRKGCVVSRINELRLFFSAGIEVPVARGTNAQPDLTKRFQINGRLEAVANVTSGKPLPNDICKICRTVIEDVYPDPWVVRAGKKRIT